MIQRIWHIWVVEALIAHESWQVLLIFCLGGQRITSLLVNAKFAENLLAFVHILRDFADCQHAKSSVLDVQLQARFCLETVTARIGVSLTGKGAARLETLRAKWGPIEGSFIFDVHFTSQTPFERRNRVQTAIVLVTDRRKIGNRATQFTIIGSFGERQARSVVDTSGTAIFVRVRTDKTGSSWPIGLCEISHVFRTHSRVHKGVS